MMRSFWLSAWAVPAAKLRASTNEAIKMCFIESPSYPSGILPIPRPRGIIHGSHRRNDQHRMTRNKTAFLFDLDGTLIDSVYQHVLAWKSSLDQEGIPLSVWRIHRKIGMSGGLFANILLRETGFDNTPDRLERLRVRHAEAYRALSASVQPLPGARELLDYLSAQGIPWAIATSGRMETAGHNLAALGVDPAKVPVVTRDQVKYAKR